TMATPYLVNSRALGADIEIHSATKYLGGHDDLFAGIVFGSSKLLQPICHTRALLGGISSPSDLVALHQYLSTFEIRMKAFSQAGLQTAQYLEKHPHINQVYYPGLSSSPYNFIAQKWALSQGRKINSDNSLGFGSVVSFELTNGSEETIESFADSFGHLGVNFGGVHTILDPFGWRQTPEMRQQLGITPALFRLSVGLDHKPEEIVGLLEESLDK
ncbi:unnamed protein product, partial [marine sediment metagenome]